MLPPMLSFFARRRGVLTVALALVLLAPLARSATVGIIAEPSVTTAMTNLMITAGAGNTKLTATGISHSSRTNLHVPGYLTLSGETNQVADNGSTLTYNGNPLAGLSTFDAGQFLAVAAIALQGATTNANGAAVTFTLADGAPVVWQTTNDVDQVITLADAPLLAGREKKWLLRVTSPAGGTALTLSGLTLVARSGTFISPPPAGLNEYLIQGIDGVFYLDVLPGTGTTGNQVFSGLYGGGLPTDTPTTSAALAYDLDPPGVLYFWDGTSWY